MAFHPDATIFTEKLLEGQESTKRLVIETSTGLASRLDEMQQMLSHLPRLLPTSASDSTDALDRELHNQIDSYRDLLRADKPRTALELLVKLNDRVGATASPRVRYRILSNIGAAHYNLGQYDTAATFLLEASPLNPDDPLSLSNRAAALLIKGRAAEAHAVAAQAMAQFPQSTDIALQRLQSLGPDETMEQVWQSLSMEAKSAAGVFTYRIGVVREIGDSRWWDLTAEARTLFPEDQGLKILHADSVIDRVLKLGAHGTGLGHENVPSQDDIAQAAETLVNAWNTSKGKETPSQPVYAHNAALAFNLLGETARAANLLDDAIASGYQPAESKQLRIALFRKQGKKNEAIALAEQLSGSAMDRLVHADMLTEIDPARARELVANRNLFTRENDVIAASLLALESHLQEKNFEAAFAEADQLIATLPGHPQGPLARFRVHQASGGDGNADLDRAVALVDDNTSFPVRLLVAEALTFAERHDEVITLLSSDTARDLDSPALRALLAAAINADRRATVKTLLKEIPESIRQKRYYTRAQVSFAIRSGNMREAENGLRSYLKNDPGSLEFHLQLLHALFRQNKLKELHDAVAIPASAFEGEPRDWLMLAHFKDDFGDWKEAHQIAYRTLLAHPNDEAVAMGYIGVFLRPGHSRELSVEAATVRPDTAVGLTLDDKSSTAYVIEPDPKLRPSPQYLAPDHRLAQILHGQPAGTQITLPDGKPATIAWIKPKTLHALHDLLEHLKNRFPEATGIERLEINTGKDNAFEEVFERLRQRHEAAERIARLYDTGALPIALVARSMGCDPIEAMVGLNSTGHIIRVCEGSHAERNAAVSAMAANSRRGCVVDALTLHVILRLQLADVVVAMCGPIHIVDASSLRIQRKVHELGETLDQESMGLSWRDGQVYRHITSPEEKREQLRQLEEERQWLAANATIIPAEGSADPNPDWKPIIERFGSGFLDDIRAAQGARLIFLSEDYLLRQLARLDFGVTGIWLQPVLMEAAAQGIMSFDAYSKAIVAFVESRFHFISISSGLLIHAVQGNTSHALPNDFLVLAGAIGGKGADMASHLSVSYAAAHTIWQNQSLSWTVRQAVVGRLFERLTEGRTPSEARAVIRIWLEQARRDGWILGNYVRDWLGGHFF
jgi:tetratricopeptide (TPR) repeat protein